MRKIKWKTHADLAIRKAHCVGREEYLTHMTFRGNERPLFTEIFGPILGLKEEWEEQGASPEELDFSAFVYRCEARGWLPVKTGGCVLALDHRIPNGTPLSNYKFYVSKVWEIINRESGI